jgi:hypothetical protein
MATAQHLVVACQVLWLLSVCVRAGADCFFGSLLFDYDTVEWLRSQLTGVPVVLVFESALELMGQTRIGSFTMDPSGALTSRSCAVHFGQRGRDLCSVEVVCAHAVRRRASAALMDPSGAQCVLS